MNVPQSPELTSASIRSALCVLLAGLALLFSAQVATAQDEPPLDELAQLARAARWFPHSAALVCRVAELQARHGSVEEAEKLAQLGLKWAQATSEDKPRLAALAERLRAAKQKTPAP